MGDLALHHKFSHKSASVEVVCTADTAQRPRQRKYGNCWYHGLESLGDAVSKFFVGHNFAGKVQKKRHNECKEGA